MPIQTARILLLADSHLGFDLPVRPKIHRRRRGHDFFANYERILKPAFSGEIDLVIHGGDLLHRSNVPMAQVEMALTPLVRIAALGIPVFIVPGNHERSRIPQNLWTIHRNLRIFHRPETIACTVRGLKLAISGFPFTRLIREKFSELVQATGFESEAADIHLLCIHQAVEGARVGPSRYTFRSGHSVVKTHEIPTKFCAVLAGHIHRSQILTHDLQGRSLSAPVIYPGSIDRTSFAERYEAKKYAIVSISLPVKGGPPEVDMSFRPLPVRPMVVLMIDGTGLSGKTILEKCEREVSTLDPDSIVRLRIRGELTSDAFELLNTAAIRSMAPEKMNISIRFDSVEKE